MSRRVPSHDFHFKKGDALVISFELLTSNREPRDISGSIIEFALVGGRQKFQYLSTDEDPYVTHSGVDGTISVSVPPAVTDTWPMRTLSYELTLTPDNGLSQTLLVGRIITHPNLVS